MTKDRLMEFQQMAGLNRNIAKKRESLDGPSSRLRNGEAAHQTQTDSFIEIKAKDDMESFHEQMAETRESLVEMAECLRKMGEIHSKILTSPGIHPKFTEQLNSYVGRFLLLSREVSNTVARIKEETSKSGTKMSGANIRIRSNHEMTLRSALQNLIGQFHFEQTQYKERCRSKINSYLKISGLDMPEEEVDQAIESGKLFNTVGIMMAERDKKLLFEDVKSRHEDIVRLEKTIRELHDMFQDLAMLVESQGEMVNHIETNVGLAKEHADNAVRTVRAAEAMKKRNIKLKIALLVGVVIAIILLFFFGTAVFCTYFRFICQ